jgi:integrase
MQAPAPPLSRAGPVDSSNIGAGPEIFLGFCGLLGHPRQVVGVAAINGPDGYSGYLVGVLLLGTSDYLGNSGPAGVQGYASFLAFVDVAVPAVDRLDRVKVVCARAEPIVDELAAEGSEPVGVWDRGRERWIAEITIGYTAGGKRIVRKASGRTKTAAQRKLKEIIRDYEDGLAIAPHNYTVADAVREWLKYGLNGRSRATVEKCTILANTHVIPDLGARKLRDLSADDVDKWLIDKATSLSTRTLRELRSVLKRAITRAQARDKVKRNVVLLCEVPEGCIGRPSKSLTMRQAEALLAAAQASSMHAYIVLSLLIGARTEELRALTWSHVDLQGKPATAETQAVPPSIMVWRSVRAGGDTKTKRSRRTLALPQRCVDVLRQHRIRQDALRQQAGSRWQDYDLVFPSRVGTPWDASHVRREFRRVVEVAGLDPHDWTPRELRHSFRVGAVRRGRSDRTDLTVGWAQRHYDDRDRLPQADQAGHGPGGGCHGSHLPDDHGGIVTQLVTQNIQRATCEDHKWPLTWSGWPDLNRRPLRPERSALPSCATPRRPRTESNRFAEPA